jgi:hypothetical protein
MRTVIILMLLTISSPALAESLQNRDNESVGNSDSPRQIEVRSWSPATSQRNVRPPLENRPVRERVRSRRLAIAGAVLTGFGLSSTLTCFVITPWEYLNSGPHDPSVDTSIWSWRNGLTLGLGGPTLLIGIILLAVGMM